MTPEKILKRYWNFDSFRYPQREIILDAAGGRDVLAVLPTGMGKSLTYQIAGLMRGGITLVISPLVALMEDQSENLKKKGLFSEVFAGFLYPNDIRRKLDNVRNGPFHFMFISPERLKNPVITDFLAQHRPNLIVVDEAHCISEWGHDFRPDYLHIKDLRNDNEDIPILALTATATKETAEDIKTQLALRNPREYYLSFYRKNIRYEVIETEDRFVQLRRLLAGGDPAIVYVNTRKNTEKIARYLQQGNISADFFHGGLQTEEKYRKLTDWLANRTKVMVATSAFGMGIDKPDVRRVIHMDIPWTPEQYVQEAGRAGRDGKPARSIILTEPVSREVFMQRLEWQLPDFSFIVRVFRRLYESHFIPEGEGEGSILDLDVITWAKKQGFIPYKTVIALKILENEGFVYMDENPGEHTKIQVIATPSKVREYLKTPPRNELKETLELLVRSVIDIFDYPVTMDIAHYARKWQIPVEKLNKNLQILDAHAWIDYKPANNDLRIILLKNYHPNLIFTYEKNIRKYLEIRRKKAEEILAYTQNNKQCRVAFLKSYFGEETGKFHCNNCDICDRLEKPGLKEIEKRVMAYLEEKPRSRTELQLLLPYPDALETVLAKLTETGQIGYNYRREYIRLK